MRALEDYGTEVLAEAASQLAVRGRTMLLPKDGESAFDKDVRHCMASAIREAGNQLDARFASQYGRTAEKATCSKCGHVGADYFAGKSPPSCRRCR